MLEEILAKHYKGNEKAFLGEQVNAAFISHVLAYKETTKPSWVSTHLRFGFCCIRFKPAAVILGHQ